MFQLLPLIVIFPLVYSANVSFPLLKDSPILRDDPLDSRPNAKVFLKNRLLDNLNNFFGSETAGALEILDSNPQKIEEDEEIPPSLPIKPTDIPSMKSGGRVIKRMDNFVHRFPTLIPTEATEPPIVTTTINMPPKNRSEGRMLSEKSIESIREWRKRLYKAFKWKKAKDLGGPGERKLAKNDQAVEKNRQLIESRREPPRHQPPHLILDKNGRLLGTETSGYKAADVSSQVARNPLPLPDHPPISSSLDSPSEFQGKRQAYRTPGHQAVVFLPAPPAPEYHQPFSQHIVTATAPPLPTLPPMITFPPQTAANLIHEYQYSTPAAPSSQQFSSLTNNQNNRFEEESQTEDDMFGSSVAMNTDCQDGMCQTSSNGQVVSEEKCNSNRLRTIIQNNIVANDAEASKRAVQTAAEAETGSYFDAVCGTGFFSYIAHTDEFCLASSAGVNCYVFSPVCADSASGTMFGLEILSLLQLRRPRAASCASHIDSASLRQPGVAMLGALLVLSAGVYAFNVETPSDISMLPSSDFIDLISRDSEAIPSPIAFGHKYMTGGAGEGEQKLAQDESFQSRQQVKSDNVLPAYCEPPNPCPVGFTSADGCLEEFENTAEFSRNYQAQQHCICDQEHMFNCADKEANDVTESLQDLLDEHGLHRNMIAKKFHEKRSSDETAPRRKRSIPEPKKTNPYLQGEPLRTMQKKDGRRTW